MSSETALKILEEAAPSVIWRVHLNRNVYLEVSGYLGDFDFPAWVFDPDRPDVGDILKRHALEGEEGLRAANARQKS